MQRADPSLGVVYRGFEHLVPAVLCAVGTIGVLYRGVECLVPPVLCAVGAIGVVYQGVERLVPAVLCAVGTIGVLYRRFEGAGGGGKFYQLLAPRSIRNELLGMLRSKAAGHLGVKKTLDQVKRRAYWSSWKTDTELVCRRCAVCCQYHRGKVPPRLGYLQGMRVGALMDRLLVDLCGPYVAAGGYTCVHRHLQFHQVCCGMAYWV